MVETIEFRVMFFSVIHEEGPVFVQATAKHSRGYRFQEWKS